MSNIKKHRIEFLILLLLNFSLLSYPIRASIRISQLDGGRNSHCFSSPEIAPNGFCVLVKKILYGGYDIESYEVIDNALTGRKIDSKHIEADVFWSATCEEGQQLTLGVAVKETLEQLAPIKFQIWQCGLSPEGKMGELATPIEICPIYFPHYFVSCFCASNNLLVYTADSYQGQATFPNPGKNNIYVCQLPLASKKNRNSPIKSFQLKRNHIGYIENISISTGGGSILASTSKNMVEYWTKAIFKNTESIIDRWSRIFNSILIPKVLSELIYAYGGFTWQWGRSTKMERQDSITRLTLGSCGRWIFLLNSYNDLRVYDTELNVKIKINGPFCSSVSPLVSSDGKLLVVSRIIEQEYRYALNLFSIQENTGNIELTSIALLPCISPPK